MRLLLASLLFFFGGGAMAQESEPFLPVRMGEHTYQLEIAADPATRTRGLMDRTAIGENDGMLFLFPKAKPYSFWMKNTHIPLDIVFIQPDGTVSNIGHGVAESLIPIRSLVPVNTVIELEAGRAARDKIVPGTKVSYELPKDIVVR